MFEKEAEEMAEAWLNERYLKDMGVRKPCKKAYKTGFQDGYDKANEWHYPSKGEYPKEREDVLCYCKVVDVKFYNVGHTIIGGDNKIRWWSSDRSEKLRVYAWKEITLPKEIKE